MRTHYCSYNNVVCQIESEYRNIGAERTKVTGAHRRHVGCPGGAKANGRSRGPRAIMRISLDATLERADRVEYARLVSASTSLSTQSGAGFRRR